MGGREEGERGREREKVREGGMEGRRKGEGGRDEREGGIYNGERGRK